MMNMTARKPKRIEPKPHLVMRHFRDNCNDVSNQTAEVLILLLLGIDIDFKKKVAPFKGNEGWSGTCKFAWVP